MMFILFACHIAFNWLFGLVNYTVPVNNKSVTHGYPYYSAHYFFRLDFETACISYHSGEEIQIP